jgi:hypothetical protein
MNSPHTVYPTGEVIHPPLVEVRNPEYVNNEYVDQMRRQTKRSCVRNQDDEPLRALLFHQPMLGQPFTVRQSESF